jgi:predicted nucleotidyltransferase component of viral defense system
MDSARDCNHINLSKAIVFKGGTVLKKMYFPDYRFSEDLDFTLLSTSISNNQIFDWFREIFDYIKEVANIPLEIVDNNEHEDGSINFHISYIGPLGGIGNNKKVKIDISKSENLVFDSVLLDMTFLYSDQELFKLLCYSLEEVLIEKLRSVIQRMQPRDFYDIWYLLEVKGMNIEFYSNQFKTKCENKEINPAVFFKKLVVRLPQYKQRWQKSLSSQIHNLYDFEQVEREVLRHFKKFKF